MSSESPQRQALPNATHHPTHPHHTDKLDTMSPLAATASCTAGCLFVVLGCVAVSAMVTWLKAHTG